MAIGTVRGAVDHVVAAFREYGWPNPTLDVDGWLAWIVARQFRAYSKEDPKTKQEKAIPLCVIKLIALKTTTESQCAIGQLIIGAFSFACRSCEYLKVPKQNQHQTKQLTLKNVSFYKDGNIIPHNLSKIYLTDSVALTFVSQKNERKHDQLYYFHSQIHGQTW